MMFFRGTGCLGGCLEGGLGFMGRNMRGGGGPLMMIGALLLAALIVVLIIAIVRKSRGSSSIGQGDESLSALNERFVRGEITEEEYTRMKKVLKTK